MQSNYEPAKRKYQEAEGIVDLPYLINAPRALSETELKRKFPNTTYSQYIESFFRRRVQSLFSSFCNTQWFKDRYFTEEEHSVYHGQISRCIRLSGVSGSSRLADVVRSVKTHVPTATVLVSDGKQEDDFERTLFVVGEDLNLEEAVDALKDTFEVDIVDLSGTKIVNHNAPGLPQIKKVFEELIKYERRRAVHVKDEDIARVVSTDTVECYSSFLRENFYFCTECCRKFDNQVEMLLNCANHTERSFCGRNYEILGYPKGVEQLKRTTETLGSHYSLTREQNYICKHCSKTFSSVEFVVTHLKNKHENITRHIPENSELMMGFLDRIDFFMFGLIFGTNVRSVPYYGACEVKENAVVYDMPGVFSGEMTLE